MPEPAQQQVAIPSGILGVTTYGQITGITSECLLNMRSFCEKNGLSNIAWRTIPGTLVEKARNELVRQTLREGMGWVCMVDGDMEFAPDSLLRLLQTAYGEMPWVDGIGAYCPLRGELALPTIDSGLGVWEAGWYPGSGVVEVMRTGAAFLLIKRHVFEALKDPWFRMRVPARPIEFMAEVDNFCNIKFHGHNPFRNLPGREWEQLEEAARNDPSVVAEQFVPSEVGEDSGLADRMRNANFRLFVHTDIACGHVEQRVTRWTDHKLAMQANELMQRQVCGILT